MPSYSNILSFDKFISYPIAERVVPFLRNTLDLTPNSITIINFIFRIGILVYYYYNSFDYVVLTLSIITHIIDCFDGHMAREFNMETNIGKYLDIYLDQVFLISVIVIFLIKNNIQNKFLILSSVIGLLSLYPLVIKYTPQLSHFIEMNFPIFIIIFYIIINND